MQRTDSANSAPVITISAYPTVPTNKDIAVTASVYGGTLNSTSHTFTENGSFDFVATDDAGNVTTKTVIITNIDKTAPIITIVPYSTESTNSSITVNASTNEGILNVSSHTFTENGSFDFIAKDEAGNESTKTVTITNIEASLSPSEIHVEKGSLSDVTTSVYGGTLTNIMNGTGTLIPNVDYTVSGNTVTISKWYLNYYFTKFPEQNLNLNFNMSNGKSTRLTIYTGVTTHVSLSPDVLIYDLKSGDAKLDLMPNGNFIASINDGNSNLLQRIDYSYSPSEHILYIRKGYLANYFSKTKEPLKLTVSFTGDTAKTVLINLK